MAHRRPMLCRAAVLFYYHAVAKSLGRQCSKGACLVVVVPPKGGCWE